MPHEVLPTHSATRFAVTLWFHDGVASETSSGNTPATTELPEAPGGGSADSDAPARSYSPSDAETGRALAGEPGAAVPSQPGAFTADPDSLD